MRRRDFLKSVAGAIAGLLALPTKTETPVEPTSYDFVFVNRKDVDAGFTLEVYTSTNEGILNRIENFTIECSDWGEYIIHIPEGEI